uniref:Reverse transcriptase domain-containing protein n=1 Tax=Solanum lycopersicum TaxID=4081 RepID=A0A3Q7JLM4_SOLLC
MPFMDKMIDRLVGKGWYYSLDGYSGYNQISIASEDQEKTTFTCPYGTFAFKRMPFGLCNAPSTFHRCIMSIFSDMVEDTIEVFMDDFSVYGESWGNDQPIIEFNLVDQH